MLIDSAHVVCMYQIKEEGSAMADCRTSPIQTLLQADPHVSMHQCSGLGPPTTFKDRSDRNPPRHWHAQVCMCCGLDPFVSISKFMYFCSLCYYYTTNMFFCFLYYSYLVLHVTYFNYLLNFSAIFIHFFYIVLLFFYIRFLLGFFNIILYLPSIFIHYLFMVG